MIITRDDQVIAESKEVVRLGTEQYVPPSAITAGVLLVKNGRTRYCHWKGEAQYYDLRVGELLLRDAAWCLEKPFWEGMDAKGMYAFDSEQVTITME